jgi:SDR family mycofactocin-dependent oxidoreductase
VDLSGKVALVTGAAQSQGREHAITLAGLGADIIAVDICSQVDFVPYRMGDESGLNETARLVEQQGSRIHTAVCDVRDAQRLRDVVDAGVEAFGGLDIVVANASICSVQKFDDVTAEIWDTTLDINVGGVWNTCTAAIGHLEHRGGGSIVVIGSTGSVVGLPFYLPYVVSKHALVGLCRSLALELSDRNIRVNMVSPTGVDTPQGHSTELPRLLEERPDLASVFVNSLPVQRIDPSDVSGAVNYLVSDAARYVTGIVLPVDAGSTIR